MIINDELFVIEDQCQDLIEAILNSDTFNQYLVQKQRLNTAADVKVLQENFLALRETVEDMERYAAYAPDFRQKKRDLRHAKRELDLHEDVANFRVAETEMQEILDMVGYRLANTISKDIKVDRGNPFFEMGSKSSCGGNCHG